MVNIVRGEDRESVENIVEKLVVISFTCHRVTRAIILIMKL